ncbi:MAG: class I SAM-dependent methyltransferase, partial [Puniceicoccales bacterium]|nr:class I SAM-dependent methyltransferase [Puniceicoccales bacterium]
MEQKKGSFRDPSGFVFIENKKIFRQINPCYFATYDQLKQADVYKELIQNGLLIGHEEVKHNDEKIILQAEKVPFVSYPYEWSFDQLKDAALLTLKLQIQLLQKNFSLKDASAYNIQFIGYNPIFIDTLSFEPYTQEPWVAFGQFCRHFLYPLMLMSRIDLRLNNLLRLWIDGIPADIIDDFLPKTTKYLSLNYWLYVKLVNSTQNKCQTKKQKVKCTLSKQQLLRILDGLASAVNSMKPKRKNTEWENYYTFTNYTNSSFLKKENLIQDFIQEVQPKTVWDLGANDGQFSRLASQRGIITIAFDIDPMAVEKNYLRARTAKDVNLLPLLIDLTNPSSGIGWGNCERESLQDRGPADLGLILALIHHLAIG